MHAGKIVKILPMRYLVNFVRIWLYFRNIFIDKNKFVFNELRNISKLFFSTIVGTKIKIRIHFNYVLHKKSEVDLSGISLHNCFFDLDTYRISVLVFLCLKKIRIIFNNTLIQIWHL